MKIEKTVPSVVLYICSLLSAFGIETNGLLGEYYADQNFGGNPVCRVDGNINFDWKSGAPMDAFPANYFSVKWSGFLDVPEEDDYTFFASVDDGIRMYIDDTVVFDAWETGSFSRTSSALRLSAGRHKIRLEYYEYNSTAWLKLSWKNSKSTDFSIIGGDYFKVDLNDGARPDGAARK